MTCVTARRHLSAYYDDELDLHVVRVVTEHLAACSGCASEARMLATVGDALRTAAPRRATPEEAASFTDGLVSRHLAEREQSLGAQCSRLLKDAHLIWAGVGATVGMAMCVLAVAGLTSFGAAVRAALPFGVLAPLGSPGSNANPVRPDGGILLPRVAIDSTVPAILIPRSPDEAELMLALSGTVTREGRIIGLEVLLANEAGRARMPELVRAAAAARFEPARIAGTRVAVNLVWLLAHTTVRGDALTASAS